MSSDLVVAHEEDDLWETIQRIRTKGIRRLPVVNKKGFLVGIVTVDDVLELLAEAFNDLAALIRRGQRREEARRA
jgi:CBS domain-containing protein